MNARSNTFCVIGLVVSFCFTGLLAFQGRPLGTLRTIDERCLAMVYGGQVGPCYQCKISSECSTKNNLDCVWKNSFNGYVVFDYTGQQAYLIEGNLKNTGTQDQPTIDTLKLCYTLYNYGDDWTCTSDDPTTATKDVYSHCTSGKIACPGG